MRQHFHSYYTFFLVTCLLWHQCSFICANDRAVTCSDNQTKEKSLDEQHIATLDIEKLLDSVILFEESRQVIGDNEWDELEVDDIIEKWKPYAVTRFDMWGLKKMLRYAPSGSQRTIKCLVKNDDLFKQLGDIFVELRETQDSLLSYWLYGNRLHYDAKSLYFGNLDKKDSSLSKMLNNNQTVLEIFQLLEGVNPCLRLLGTLGLGGVITGFVLSKTLGGQFSIKESIMSGLMEPIRNHTLTRSVWKDENCNMHDKHKMFQFATSSTLADKYVFYKLFMYSILEKYIKNEGVATITASVLSGFTQAALVALSDYKLISGTKRSLEKIRFLYKTTRQLHTNFVSIASFVKALKKIDDLSKRYPHLKAAEPIQYITKFFQKQALSNKLEKLLGLLETRTFDYPCAVFSRGRLLMAHKLFCEIKEELIPLLQQLAVLGGYRMIADIFRDHTNKSVKFCFVKFVEHQGPYVQIKNGWLPILDEDKVVTNSIALGGEGTASHAVITGPNGGGKSTAMSMVAYNLLLSRLGIAAAQEALVSDFQRIRTSLHPRASIKSQRSTFMQEQARIQDVLDDINTCDGNILVLLDEPYKGTFETESAERLCQFGSSIVNSKNCILLMATHLQQATDLATDTNGLFKNLQMGYTQKDDNTFERTFKLEAGPALWWFENAQMRSSFIDWLCAIEGD